MTEKINLLTREKLLEPDKVKNSGLNKNKAE